MFLLEANWCDILSFASICYFVLCNHLLFLSFAIICYFCLLQSFIIFVFCNHWLFCPLQSFVSLVFVCLLCYFVWLLHRVYPSLNVTVNNNKDEQNRWVLFIVHRYKLTKLIRIQRSIQPIKKMIINPKTIKHFEYISMCWGTLNENQWRVNTSK